MVFSQLQDSHERFLDPHNLHTDLLKTIARLEFATATVATNGKPHLRLGPLAFVPRDANGIARVTRVTSKLGYGSHHLKLGDLDTATMAPPQAPSNLHELCSALLLQHNTLLSVPCSLQHALWQSSSRTCSYSTIQWNLTNLATASSLFTIPSILQIVTDETKWLLL
jgi:hypothetical protein